MILIKKKNDETVVEVKGTDIEELFNDFEGLFCYLDEYKDHADVFLNALKYHIEDAENKKKKLSKGFEEA